MIRYMMCGFCFGHFKLVAPATVAQRVRALATQAEGWELESQTKVAKNRYM